MPLRCARPVSSTWLPLSNVNLLKIISALHRRFPKGFTHSVNSLLSTALLPPQRAAGSSAGGQGNIASSIPVTATGSAITMAAASATAPEQKEKEDAARIARQRPVLRVCAELALVGIIKDAPGKSGGEWMMKTLKDLVSDIIG